MTDNAPERIWTNGVWVYGEHSGFGGTEYIRADLYTAVCAERDRALEWRDMMGRLWEKEKARAEAAEADVEKWKQAFATQSRKLQSVLHIEGVRAALQEKPHD